MNKKFIKRVKNSYYVFALTPNSCRYSTAFNYENARTIYRNMTPGDGMYCGIKEFVKFLKENGKNIDYDKFYKALK
jgi:hypothetical protein